MEDFNKLKSFILHYLRGLWSNRWLAIAIAWSLMLVGFFEVDRMEFRYTAEAKLNLNYSAVLNPLLKRGAIQSSHQSRMHLIRNKLLSHSNLQQAVNALAINLPDAKTVDQQIDILYERVFLSSENANKQYLIGYSDADRDTATVMLQQLLNVFQKFPLGEDDPQNKKVKFQVIEPPYAPMMPDFPNKPLLDVAVLIIALGFGYGVAFLISLFKPVVVYNARDLVNYTGRKVLASIENNDLSAADKSQQQRNHIVFTIIHLLLIGSAVATMMMHAQGMYIVTDLQNWVSGL